MTRRIRVTRTEPNRVELTDEPDASRALLRGRVEVIVRVLDAALVNVRVRVRS